MDSLHQELDFQHLVDVKGGLETARSLCAGDQGDLPTGGAGDGRLVMALLDHQWLEALLAVRVKACPLPCVRGERRGHRHEFCSGVVLGRALKVEAQQVGRVLIQL